MNSSTTKMDSDPPNTELNSIFKDLEQGIYDSLTTYSNVHRGSGYSSQISTELFEKARLIILDYLDLNHKQYQVIFCTPDRANSIKQGVNSEMYRSISSKEIGFPMGVVAIAIKKDALPKGIPFHSGGGTTKLTSKDWIIWADAPDKHEAGTPAIINIIALAIALQIIKKTGKDFSSEPQVPLTTEDVLYKDELEDYSGSELYEELNKTLIGLNLQVPTIDGFQSNINLDNSASTPTFEPIWNTFRKTLRQPENIQAVIVNEVKSIIAEFINAPSSTYEILFTSNTTESVNILARYQQFINDDGTEPVILSTILEHSSNDLPWRMIASASVVRLPVDKYGFIDLEVLESVLTAYNKDKKYDKKRIKLLSISGASNVLGVCNNLTEISKITKRYNVALMVDAAQLVAHRKINMVETGIDFMAFSAHKIYAPFGCGVLVTKNSKMNFPDSELNMIRESGEENAAGIAALGKAITLIQRIGMDEIVNKEQELTRYTLNALKNIEGVKLYGIQDPDSKEFEDKVGVIPFSIKGMLPKRVANELALYGGIGVRHGCHCAHIIVKHMLGIPPAVEQLQRVIQVLFPKIRLPGVVRVSLGIENTREEIDMLIHALEQVASKKKNPEVKTAQKQMNKFIGQTCELIYSI